MSDWQPIDENTPRDGTQIFLCRATDADGKPITGRDFGIFCQVAAWWENEGEDDGEWVVYCDLIEDPRLHFMPTHWKPLDEPPEIP